MQRVVKFRTDYKSQIIVCDANATDWMLDYNELALRRGFASVRDLVAFFTMIEDGLADLSVWFGKPASTTDFSKTALAQLSVISGELCISEPENPPLTLTVPPGEYNVLFAQKETDINNFLEINVFLDRQAENRT